MKIANTKLKRGLIFVIGPIIFILMVGIILTSPFAKYLIEKFDEQYTGRQIKMDWIYVNPFTGYVYISNLKIFESRTLPSLTKSDTVFFSAKGVGANFALLKLFSKTIEISRFTVNQPRGTIIQNKRDFNFNDLIKKFTPEKPAQTSSKVHFNILSINIKNGEFYYHEKGIPVQYFIKKVNFESTGKYWKADTIAAKFSFLSGTGTGRAKGSFTINIKNLDYRIAVIVQKFNLKFIEQYLKDLANYGNFDANLDADMVASGNITDQENLNVKGLFEMNDFHFGKNPDDDYVSFDKLVLKIDSLSPKNHLYIIDSLSLTHPFLKYERYDYLDNLQRMFGKNGANISAAKADPARFNLILQITDYIKVIAKNFFRSDYKINKLAVYRGDLRFNDYNLTEKFSTEASPLYIIADSVNKNRKRVEASFKSAIQPYGNVSVFLSINPKDSGDFDVHYHFLSLPVSMFNPYLITYTSFPLDGGTIELNGSWKVRNGIIDSDNHLLVIDPCITKRQKNKETKWIPSPLIMSFIKERGNVIDYEIPITGNLKNPKFHLHDVIMDILGNIFVKPATIPYRAQVKKIENEIEKSLTLQWEMRQSSQLPNQEFFVNKMAEFLIHNPEASISVYPIQYAEKEKEYIQFFEAKKKYFLLSKDKNAQFLSEEDSLKVDKMSVKDPVFVKFLNKQVNGTMLFTIQGKCSIYIGSSLVNRKFNQLNQDREDTFMLFFRKKALENRVKIHAGENSIPYNGFSFFKIVYEGELPESLIRAYHQMNELNNMSPRKRFKIEREKNKSNLQIMKQ
jgi:hypothetical protein